MRFLRPRGSLPFLAAIAAVASPQPPAKDKELTGNAATAAEFGAAEAVRYDIRHAADEKRALQLVPRPVLRWSNSTGSEVHGSVYLWTLNGCPEAAASIYQFFGQRQQLNVELVSLSEVALKAARNGRARWTPEPGLKFTPTPGPEPADTADRRQAQLRLLARKFTGDLVEPNEASDRPTELRLMANPLYRYEASDKSGREGAVFALVTTTDPEIVLVIESRPGRGGGREWVWAAARMHFRPLRLKLADKVVWEVPAAAPPWDKLRGPDGKYVILEWRTAEAAAKD